jgi:hypothetical protein
VQGLEWRCSRDNYPIDGTIATLGIAHGHVSASVVRRKSAVVQRLITQHQLWEVRKDFTMHARL